MWPFSSKQKCSEGIPQEFQERLDKIESQVKLLRVEWDEIYDKIVHQFDRERKRKGKVITDASALVEPNGSDPQGTSGVSGGDWADPVYIMQEARKRGL